MGILKRTAPIKSLGSERSFRLLKLFAFDEQALFKLKTFLINLIGCRLGEVIVNSEWVRSFKLGGLS